MCYMCQQETYCGWSSWPQVFLLLSDPRDPLDLHNSGGELVKKSKAAKDSQYYKTKCIQAPWSQFSSQKVGISFGDGLYLTAETAPSIYFGRG